MDLLDVNLSCKQFKYGDWMALFSFIVGGYFFYCDSHVFSIKL